MFHSACVETKGQPAELVFCFHHVGLRAQTQMAWGQVLLPIELACLLILFQPDDGCTDAESTDPEGQMYW